MSILYLIVVISKADRLIRYKNRMESPDMVPDVIGMKGMLTMIAYEQQGMIDEYLSLNTLHQYTIRFGTVCKEMLKVEMPKDSLLEVKNVRQLNRIC